ncbi:hypothetical protein BDA99DRAFT_543771 [Phascolomyces articulosus]|uniref:Uncharacterized protein n=1 Tax=Phascolomyces articulosus TaxID=60185 RepID=A0AAD5K029_9FUNG|nr:hypothetical protein BDA99DRAFT_543771 [Phascolomyces articulosus]
MEGDVIASWLFELLQEKQSEETWDDLCTALLKTDEEDANNERINVIRNEITLTDPNIMGPIDRPFYLGMARTIAYCFHNNELPPNLVRNPIHLLVVTNIERLGMIQKQLRTIEHSKNGLQQLLFNTLSHEDWRIFLHIRTTAGGNTFHVMPPSLNECIDTFTRVYQKPNAKPRRHGQQYQLSVGAKALSKHWHRDREEQFWGVCTGTETKKNEHANQILIKILSDPVWINLHSLPHDRTVYEIRQSQGYGVRWTIDEKGGAWDFRGFLEPQMEDGHASKWVH